MHQGSADSGGRGFELTGSRHEANGMTSGVKSSGTDWRSECAIKAIFLVSGFRCQAAKEQILTPETAEIV
jgi:hypothetical protein